MMLGGGLMLGMGLLIMLLVFGIPILLLIALLGGAAGYQQKQSHPAAVINKPFFTAANSVVPSSPGVVTPSRYCAHCGAGLQADWTHCPQCGAPIN